MCARTTSGNKIVVKGPILAPRDIWRRLEPRQTLRLFQVSAWSSREGSLAYFKSNSRTSRAPVERHRGRLEPTESKELRCGKQWQREERDIVLSAIVRLPIPALFSPVAYITPGGHPAPAASSSAHLACRLEPAVKTDRTRPRKAAMTGEKLVHGALCSGQSRYTWSILSEKKANKGGQILMG